MREDREGEEGEFISLEKRSTALNPQINPNLIQQDASLTSAPSSTSSVHHLQQFGVDGLSGLLQNPDQLPGLGGGSLG